MQKTGLFVGGAMALALLSGCGTVARSTGAMQLGPDTYRIAVRAPLGSVAESQRMALTEAKAYCAGLSSELLVVSTRRLEDLGGGPFEATFRCLKSGDAELQRPNLQKPPDTVIQIK